MHGEPCRHFEALGGWKDLEYTIDTRGADDPLTKLVPDLRGIDPDDAFSSVPYEKGHTLLFHLEQLCGKEAFEAFLRTYIEKYKNRSIDTDEWKSYLYEYFKDKEDILNQVAWDDWLYSPGMPPLKPDYDTSLADRCISLCKDWISASCNELDKFTDKDLEDMTSPQVREFLALLLKENPLSEEKIQKLTEIYKLDNKMNSEIRFRWLRLGLLAHWKPIIPHAIKFVVEQGRMKFVRPLYRDMYDWEETRELAISTYREHFYEMMYVTAYTVAKDLHLERKEKDSPEV